VKDAEDIDVPIRAALVDDPVTTVQQDSDTRILLRLVQMPDVREGEREVGLLVDAVHHLVRCGRTVAADVLVDLAQPPARLWRPDQARHESIVRFISSSEMTRPASASARPRSTMRLKTSSSSISS
jgi:hypothetical protein